MQRIVSVSRRMVSIPKRNYYVKPSNDLDLKIENSKIISKHHDRLNKMTTDIHDLSVKIESLNHTRETQYGLICAFGVVIIGTIIR